MLTFAEMKWCPIFLQKKVPMHNLLGSVWQNIMGEIFVVGIGPNGQPQEDGANFLNVSTMEKSSFSIAV